jgi:ABC-type nitrate/sulfonate/bicarbonate transport system substrate-binding protein
MSAYLMIPVAAQNREVVMLSGVTRYASMSLVARPEIRGAGDLAGTVLGLQRPGDAYEKNARSALQHLGLNPDKDVKFLYLGSNEVMWLALEQRRVVRAMVRGIHCYKSRKEETLRILSKFLGTKDREALEESWHYASDMPAKPYAVESAVQAVINHLAERDEKFAKYKPAEFIESGPLAELDKSGYIDRLYGKYKQF